MSEVHDLVYHGRGGFPYETVYNMPITYRKYHIRKIQEYLDKKADNNQTPQPAHQRPFILKKAIEIAQDGAEVVGDILDDLQDLTGVNAAKRLASLKAWLIPHLILQMSLIVCKAWLQKLIKQMA